MRLFILTILSVFSIHAYSFEYAECSQSLNEDDPEAIKWYDFEGAIDQCEEKKKPIFIDIYTSWCGWCKKMDNETFKNPDVVSYMNEHFYSVKMDAESKEPIAFKEVLYEYKTFKGGSGYNELAVNLLGGKMSFPSFVILSKRQVKVGTLKGYQKPKELLTALKKYAKK